jgi:hypothetical protein
MAQSASLNGLLLYLLDRSKYKEYRFDREMSRAMLPITGVATNRDPDVTAQSFVETRLHAIDALGALVPPNHEWGEVRDSISGVLRYEIDVAQGSSPVDIEEHRSRSATFVAQLHRLRLGYRLRSRSESTPGNGQ